MNKRPISTQILSLSAQNGMSLSAALTQNVITLQEKKEWPALAPGDVGLGMKVDRAAQLLKI